MNELSQAQTIRFLSYCKFTATVGFMGNQALGSAALIFAVSITTKTKTCNIVRVMNNITGFSDTISRLLADRLERLHAHFPVVVVSGARQVGKTTLLRQHFPEYDYVCFDPALDLENARSEPDIFLDNHKPPVILDEIQYAPELVAAIKRRVDANAHASGMYLLSGSQQWQVLKVLAESLAGRVAFLDLHGFSLAEIARSSGSWLADWLQDPQVFVGNL